MKLYDLLSSADTKPLDKIRRTTPEWANIFLLIPLQKNEDLYGINVSINKMDVYVPSISDLLATDWIKF